MGDLERSEGCRRPMVQPSYLNNNSGLVDHAVGKLETSEDALRPREPRNKLATGPSLAGIILLAVFDATF